MTPAGDFAKWLTRGDLTLTAEEVAELNNSIGLSLARALVGRQPATPLLPMAPVSRPFGQSVPRSMRGMVKGTGKARSSGPSLEITVLTGITGEAADVSRELELVKAALVYADHVRLVSPKAALLRAAFGLLELPERDRQNRIVDIASSMLTDEQAELLAHLRPRKGQARRPELIALAEQLRAHMRPQMAEVDAVMDAFRQHPSVLELRRAEESGALTLDTLGLRPVPTIVDSLLVASGARERGASKLDIVERLVGEISRSVAPKATTFPMFDEQAGGLLRAMIAEGVVPDADLAPAKHAHFAGYLAGTVSTFPEAKVDEILDVRRDLQEPLVRFRGAVTGMARDLETTPLDDRFRREAEELYRERVVPELLTLDESMREARLGRQLRRQGGELAPAIPPAVVLAFAAYTALPDMAAVAAAAGAVAGALAGRGGAVAKRRHELAMQRQQNKFLFLHEAEQRLGASTSGRTRS